METNQNITQRFSRLDDIYRKIKEYEKDYSKIRRDGFESFYGEILTAKKLVDEGFCIESLRKEGCDILLGNRKRIEVKTSRLVKRFSACKNEGYGWDISESQWKNKKFDYAICLALEYFNGEHGILAFSYGEVIKNFTFSSWNYMNSGKRVKDHYSLSLIPGGIESFENFIKDARKKSGFDGEPSDFERRLNENPDKIFEKYSWERFIPELKK